MCLSVSMTHWHCGFLDVYSLFIFMVKGILKRRSTRGNIQHRKIANVFHFKVQYDLDKVTSVSKITFKLQSPIL